MFKLKTIMSLAVILMISNTALAVDTPTALAGTTIVTAERVKSMLANGAKIFDVRVATEYVEEHIPGAINIPYKENSKKEAGFDASVDKFNLEMIGADKNVSAIFQCNGAECWKSYKAAALATKGGFKNVFWFRGGLPEWKSKSYPVEK